MRNFENIPKGGNLSRAIPRGMVCGFQSTISPAKKFWSHIIAQAVNRCVSCAKSLRKRMGIFSGLCPKAYPDEYEKRMRRYLHEIKTGLLTRICDPPEEIGLYEEIYLLCPACLGFIPPPLRSFLCMCDFSGKPSACFVCARRSIRMNLRLPRSPFAPARRSKYFARAGMELTRAAPFQCVADARRRRPVLGRFRTAACTPC